MTVQDKYKTLIDTAQQLNVSNFQIKEQDGVLYITGDTQSADVKDKLWNVYNEIDPDYKTGDVILTISASMATGTKATVSTNSSNLNIRKGPGTDQEIIGKAARNEIITILSAPNDQWSLIKTDRGEEGYVYTQYLTAN